MKRRSKPPVPEENLAADTATILQIKVWLTGISPMVWRRVLVPSSFTLRELHGVIQVAMGWEGIHLYDFQLGFFDAKVRKTTSQGLETRRSPPFMSRESRGGDWPIQTCDWGR